MIYQVEALLHRSEENDLSVKIPIALAIVNGILHSNCERMGSY